MSAEPQPPEPPEPSGPPGQASTPPPPPSPSPPPGGREVLAAGFTHRDRENGARGFAAGGPLDLMAPGAALAAAADAAAAAGLAALNDDELIGLLCAARRLTSWAASLELRAVSGLAGRRAAHAAATRDSRQADHVADEVAAALTLTCRSADRLLHLAAALTRLPAAAAALAAGRIDMPKAIAFTDELSGLGDVAAAAVAAVTAPDAAALTTSELRRLLRRTVLAIDPDAARKRREKAQKNARVECWADASGTWSLAGRDLPPAEVLAADQRTDADARALKKAGAAGTLDYLRSRVFLARLNDQPLWTLLPGQDPDGRSTTPSHDSEPGHDSQDQDRDGQDQDRDGHDGGPGADGHDEDSHDGGPGADGHDEDSHDGGPGADGQDGDGQDGDEEGPGRGPGGGSPRPGPATPGGGAGRAAGLTGSVNLTIPLTTWLGLTGHPGEAAGHGPLDAAAARDLANALAARPATRWCLTITTPRGTAIGHGCAPPGHPPPPGSPWPGSPGPPGTTPSQPGSPGAGPPGTTPPGTAPPGAPPGTAPPGAPPGTGPPGAGPPCDCAGPRGT